MHSISPPVAHCNLKAANILLDAELMPQVSDCGLSVLRPLTTNDVKLKVNAPVRNIWYHKLAQDGFTAKGARPESNNHLGEELKTRH